MRSSVKSKELGLKMPKHEKALSVFICFIFFFPPPQGISLRSKVYKVVPIKYLIPGLTNKKYKNMNINSYSDLC